MKLSVRIMFVLAALAAPGVLCAQGELRLGFYNVENLYDTIPSLFGKDADFTPNGKMRWGTERYTAKLNNLARVLDDMSLDVAALAEVESEAALRDLVRTLKTDYNYIHRTSGDYRGMDLALLYKGDRFVPEHVKLIRSGSSREFLYVRGELAGHRVDIVICHLPSQINPREDRARTLQKLSSFADSLRRTDRGARLVVMGDFNADPSDRDMKRYMGSGRREVDGSRALFHPLATLAAKGVGTYVYANRWHMYDNVFLDTGFLSGEGLRYNNCGVFIRPYMLSGDVVSRNGAPLRTFSRGAYVSGYSDHLPVWVTVTSAPK